MVTSQWSLQDAKNQFSAVVKEALKGVPQRVTRRGKPAVVVIAAADYERLKQLEKANAPSLGDLLLAIPQDDPSGRSEIEPIQPILRDVDL